MSIGAGKTVTIVGAGLAGSLLAIYLARLGFSVGVHERRGDPRRAGEAPGGEGRSINLALSARGLWGLEGVGLDREVLAQALPMTGRMMHPADPGRPVYFQPYSSNPGDSIKSISRAGLNRLLLEAAAEHENVSLVFESRCVDVDLDECAAVFQDEGGAVSAVGSDLIIGADGAFSAVRGRLQKTDRFEYSQSFLSHGYKELRIPPLPGTSPDFERWGGFALDPGALHIWPRGKAMMIALPNTDRSFTCTLFWPFEGEHSFANLRSGGEVGSFFRTHYPDAVPLMPTLAEDYLGNAVGSLVTVRCRPWVHECPGGKAAVLLGDAAHAIVPFFGQGMNAAFEDVRILCECLERHSPPAHGSGAEWPLEAAKEYQSLRKPNTDAIARMALDNFVEMRDKVGSRVFLFRKQVEHLLHELAPQALTPKYNLVSFSLVPYAEALRRGTRIDRALRVLVLWAALIVVGLLSLIWPRPWLLVGFLLIAAWRIWDHWETQKSTSV